jgi:hypothetical protein
MTFDEVREELAEAKKEAIAKVAEDKGFDKLEQTDFTVRMTAEAVRCLRDRGMMQDPTKVYEVGGYPISHKDADKIEVVPVRVKGD